MTERKPHDWHGREIRVGDTVRHVYEPWSGKDSCPFGKGYHNHWLAGTAEVVEAHRTTVEVKQAFVGIPIYLGCLLEVITSDEQRNRGYIIPLDGEYREPPIKAKAAA